MIKFEHSFHIDRFDLAKTMIKDTSELGATLNRIDEFFDVDTSMGRNLGNLQVVFTSYETILNCRKDWKWFADLIVDTIQRDNPNVVAFDETFMITF